MGEVSSSLLLKRVGSTVRVVIIVGFVAFGLLVLTEATGLDLVALAE